MKQRKHPPVGRPFQPGQSGNPSGRPKETAGFRAWCREFMDEHGTTELGTLALKAEDERVRVLALRFIAESGYGKPRESVEISGEVTHRYLATFDATDSDLSLAESEQSRPEVRH